MDPKQLSPMYFRGNEDEKAAYVAAYNQLLTYYRHNEVVANRLHEILKKALYEGETDDLMNWYNIHAHYAKRD